MGIVLKENQTMADVVKQLEMASEWVYEIAPIAYWYECLDAEGRVREIHFSRRMREMLGYESAAEFPDAVDTLVKHTHPEDLGTMLEGAIRAAAGETEKYDERCRIRKADGQYMWCNATGQAIRDQKGAIVGMYGAFIDITEEIRLNEERETQRQIEEIIEGFCREYDAVFCGHIQDNTYRKLTNVDAVDRQTGEITAFDAAMKRYVASFVHPEDAALFRGEFTDTEAIRKNIPVGGSKTFEYRSRSGGGYAWYRATMRRVSETEALVGFRNCDRETVARIVSEKVIGDFASVFVVYIKNDRFRFISRNSDSGFRYVPEGVYTDTIREYISRVNPDYREWWNNMPDLEKVRRMLTENSRLEYVYPLENTEKRWRRCVVETLDKEDGVPTSFVMTYFVLDDASAENQELTEQIAQNRERLQEAYDRLNGAYRRLELTHSALKAGQWAFDIDADGRVTGARYDEFIRERVRFDPADPMGWTRAIHPEDRERVIGEFMAAVKDRTGETPYETTYRMTLGDGGTAWIKTSGKRLGHADGSGEIIGITVNITEQMEAQRKRLLGAVPISPDILAKENIGMWAFEKDAGQPPRMYGDEAMIRLVGLDGQVSPEEMYQAWYAGIDEGSRGLVADAVDKMSAGEHAEVQYPWRGRDGRTMIVRCGGIRNPAYTKGTRIEGTHQNVTEMTRFDESEIRLRREMNTIYSLSDEFDVIMLIDPASGEYGWYGKETREAEAQTGLGARGTDFYGNTAGVIERLIHPEDREVFMAVFSRENLTRIAGTGEKQETENRWRLGPGGGYLWKYNKLARVKDETGRVFVAVGVIDTTEKKNQEAEINEQKRMLEQQRALSDGLAREYHTVWLMEGEGQHRMRLYRSTGRGTIRGAVQIALDDPSYDPGIVKYVRDYVHEDDQERVLEATRFDTIERETPEIGTYVVSYRRYNEGHTAYDYHQMVYARAAGADGKTNYIFAYRDADKMLREQIAQQKRLAEALSMAESANRAKTTFLNNMSHDIRTPMNAIIGYAGLAASHIDNKAQVKDYLAKIGQSGAHLLSLINDVLDMSRIESGKMVLEEKPENLPDIIHTLHDIVLADIRGKQQDFFIDTVDVADENVVCDKLRLNQVLLNILSNSIKYTSPGGTISMRITEKTVKSNGYATYEFRIKDNGMGMSREFLEHIFDPFERAGSSTVSGIQGTGLGMAITKNIVDMMGGQIAIDSEPGVGTETRVTFDFRRADKPELIDLEEIRGLRGLVVDDDAGSCISIAKMLKDAGMRDEWCTTGREAVLRAEEAYHRGDLFRVYIIDWMMPDMNGIETARRIRRVIGEDAPIVIMTAYDWADIETEAREAGVTGFVSKPLFPSDLHRTLSRCLGKPAETAEVGDTAPDFAGKRVLLVEDNALNREIATEVLQEYGFTVDAAEDGDIAVERMRTARPGDYDLVLMDVQMPRMDGYEATRQIRALGTEVSQVPILAMTANAFEEDRRLALAAGMNEHVTKPIDIRKLRETLGRFL